ncbi:MAG: hypothetical protein Q4C68_04435 [Moraxella sp.]|nr:hypothetical protein [Moraxella sp.]
MKRIFCTAMIMLCLSLSMAAHANTAATPTPLQLQNISKLVVNAPNGITDTATKTAVTQAIDPIAQLLLIASCSTEEFNLSLGGIQALNAQSFNLMNIMSYLQYHPKNQCVSVKNIGNWQMPAKNALTFRVIYHSDISGETATALVSMIYDNGNWLVLEHMVRT